MFHELIKFATHLYRMWSFLLRTIKGNKVNIQVLHHSSNFIVINKNYDILINSNDPTISESLHSQLSKAYPSLINPKLVHNFHFVHRLDYVTSGVLCVALNKAAATAAATSFEERLASKYYIALLRGHVHGEIIDVATPIGEVGVVGEKETPHKMCTPASRDCRSPRAAHTRLVVLQRGLFQTYPATKVLLKPTTGRRHQLRVHCASLGHTIVGDFTYSSRKDVSPYRTFLHALRLVLPNRVEGLDIECCDPFTEAHLRADWLPVETLNDIHSAFQKSDNPTHLLLTS